MGKAMLLSSWVPIEGAWRVSFYGALNC